MSTHCDRTFGRSTDSAMQSWLDTGEPRSRKPRSLRNSDRGEEYVERNLAAMETERRDRQIKHLQRQARHFDLALVPAEQAA